MDIATYEDLLRDVYENGSFKGDRTGTGTRSVFGRQIRYNLAEGFPLITSKRVPFRLVAEELLWFLTGESDLKPLLEKDVHIWSQWPYKAYLLATNQPVPPDDSVEWDEGMRAFELRVLGDDEFAKQYGQLGPVYGVQWRNWPTRDGGTIDQISNALHLLKTNPNSRRILVSAWNPEDLPVMALEPCHALFQFYVVDGKLSCQLYQRSCDMFLGVPFNIASYALFTHMMAQQADLEVGDFVWTGGDTHIYSNHFDQVDEQLSREHLPLPQLELVDKPASIFGYSTKNFVLKDYNPHPAIKARVAV